MSALQTGLRLLPLSFALLVTAVGVPKLAPSARPRLIVRLGLLSMLAGTLILISGLGTALVGAVLIASLTSG